MIVKIYGTYFGPRRLSFIGFKNRADKAFTFNPRGQLIRSGERSEPGWLPFYTMEQA